MDEIEKNRQAFKNYALNTFNGIKEYVSESDKNDLSDAFAAGALLSLAITLQDIDFYISYMSQNKQAVEVAKFIRERIIYSNSNIK